MLDQQKDAIQNLIVRALAALDVADVVPQLEKPKESSNFLVFHKKRSIP